MDGKEPEWMAGERETFLEFRDKNKDGKLDMEEVSSWTWPQDYDHAGVEAKHLITMADHNKVLVKNILT